MSGDAEKRMERLRDELMNIRYDYKWSAFDIIKSSPPTPISWTIQEHDFLRAWVSELGTEYFQLRYAEPDVRSWFDPLPDRKSCIWWCGLKNDRGGAERLLDWADRCAQYFALNFPLSRRFQVYKPSSGRGHLLQALCEFAKTTPQLSEFIDEKVILDLAVKKLPRRIPMSLRQLKPPCSLSLLTPSGSGPLFLLRVIDHVLGKPSSGPRLTVDVKKEEVTLDGTIYHLDWPYILVVDALVKAKGNPITRRRMKDLYPDLKGYKRLDRKVIHKIEERECPQIGALIESDEHGYRFPPDLLA